MPVKTLHDSVSGKTGTRQKVHKDKTGRSVYEYSNGAELIMEKTADGVPGKMKEVRTVVQAKAPKGWSRIEWPAGAYERIFGHE